MINSRKDSTHYLTLPLKIMCSLFKNWIFLYRRATNQFSFSFKGEQVKLMIRVYFKYE